MRLEVDALAARRGGEMIFEDVSFALAAGEAVAVTGPNGAGKSTLLRVLAGFLAPAAGKALMVGAPGGVTDIAAHSHFLSPMNAMKPALTVHENLKFWRAIIEQPALTPEQALTRVGLPHVIDVPFSDLSTGQRRRVAIARLLINHKPVWLLDEPTSGLDARAEAAFAGLLEAHINEGGIVIAATHLAIDVPAIKRLRFAERVPAQVST